MNAERLPAKICKFVNTFLAVDLYSFPTSKLLPYGLTVTHVVVTYHIDNKNSFSNPYFAVNPNDRLAD